MILPESGRLWPGMMPLPLFRTCEDGKNWQNHKEYNQAAVVAIAVLALGRGSRLSGIYCRKAEF